ncbi:unnamed protein product [Lupinus luteus]|uniref:DUF868 domain-containing protein n=1 Tax=Lupinus luteus TaxID=3873 RepID=A0AAV1XHH7_LUPLU
MKDFPSCFGENAVQVADFSSSYSNSTKHAQNLVICVYQCIMKGKSCLISITWSKSLMGQGLSVGIDDSSNQCLCKVDIKPWVFSKRRGCKSLQAYSSKVDVFWDFSSAKFGAGPEPLEGFYVCVVLDRQIVMLLGDLKKKAFKKSNAIPLPCNSVFVAKKEHVFGKRLFENKAVFCDNGKVHDLVIECDTWSVSDPCLTIRIDSKTVMQVKRLKWKFRGNCTIFVDGFAVEVYWDVYNWLFGNGTSLGNAVFMFRTCHNEDKWWVSKPVSDKNMLQSSLSQRFSETKLQGLGFSLMLYAWKNE